MSQEYESRISVVIDGKQATLSANDTEKALRALDQAGIRVTKTTDQLGTTSDKTSKQARGIESSANTVNSALSRLGGVIAGIGFAGLIKSSIDSAAQLDVLSERLDISVEQLSRQSYAAKTVGVETDKLADIYKDMSDRIGDFAQTGGGPMVDFFEQIAPKVGVTVEQFQKLCIFRPIMNTHSGRT